MINVQAYAMEEGFPLNFLQSAVRFSVLSLLLFLVDIALDLWAIVSFYEEQKYFSMGLLVCILLSSSVLLQIYSWIWYTDSSKNLKTNVEEFISRPWLMNIVHIFQLGVFTRFAAVIEISSNRCKLGEPLKKRLSVYLNQDLSMLRLFEAFSESAPQLVLMVTLIMEMPELHFFTVIKIFASLSSISITMLSYHCFMLSFLFEKFKMGWISSVIYFLWNLLLIGSRIVCVSLFASVLPCYIAAHFLSLWMLLFLWAWWQNTDFMDSKPGEWLYRATVGLIWYFSWFNVTSGNTGRIGIIYHVVIVMDMMLLVGLWWWRITVESARLSPLPFNPYIVIALLMFSYIIGILLKFVYHWKLHPKPNELQLCEKEEEYILTDSVLTQRKRNLLINYCKFLPKQSDLQIQVDVQDDKPETKAKSMLCTGGTEETDSNEMWEPKPASLLDPEVTVTAPTQRIGSLGAYKRMKNMTMNFYC